jgi:UDP-GlcNAc3NAcA epimerase
MRLVSIAGARPQFIKLAPFSRAYARHRISGGEPIEDLIVHTGQHYDHGMSEVFFRELELPKAAFHLGVGSGSHAVQTARMLEGIERVLLETRPDVVMVYGDTNSTVAGALAAAKLHIPVAHVESGLRSFNRRMPEEINRIVVDHIADRLYAPTATAMQNLAHEGLLERAVRSGDSMYDTVLIHRDLARRKSTVLMALGLDAFAYGVVTIHRAENTDDPVRLGRLLEALNEVVADGTTLVFPVHPRTRAAVRARAPHWKPAEGLRLVEPLGYLDMLRLVDNARVALTDSGGLQKEAFFLGCPCVTLREETEWVETVEGGGNRVAGTDAARIRGAVRDWRERCPQGKGGFTQAVAAMFGDGHAAEQIVQDILAFHWGHKVRANARH